MVHVLINGYADTEAAIEAINCGRVHRYVSKPWERDELANILQQELEENSALRQTVIQQFSLGDLVGRSPAIAAEAGFVPWAESGNSTDLRSVSPR